MHPAVWIGLALSLLALVAISMVVDAMRQKPIPPAGLAWGPAIPILHTDIGGVRTRYIRAGAGPSLVLLHTLRTQLDIFQKVIPDLAKEFTVYAVDFPGHGWSDIPKADYTPAFFTRFTTGFLDALKIENALVAGVSIGATIPLLMAAERNPRIRAVVSINSYDYGKRGIERANIVARILFTLAAIPVIGETVMRLRNPMVERKILAGGVATPSALPPAFVAEVFRVGEWRDSHQVYGRIQLPVLLVYGDHDWSREADRQATLREIPGARLTLVGNGGHFLPLDRPEAVIQQIRAFARELGILPAVP